MDLAVVVTTFVVIFPAELPDKSLFASLVLGTRFRPLPVFCGVAAAFAVHVLIAVSVGGVFALLPERLVLFVVSAMFAGGSALLLLGREEDDEEAVAAARAVADRRPVRVAPGTGPGAALVGARRGRGRVCTLTRCRAPTGAPNPSGAPAGG